MAKMIIDIPDNMQEMCKWHKEGICDLTNIEIYILVEAIIKGTQFSGGEWIPISERLPEDYQRILVTVVRYNGNKIVRVAEYYNRNNGKGIFQIKENDERWEVGEKGLLAWMPLPALFEPQESEEI